MMFTNEVDLRNGEKSRKRSPTEFFCSLCSTYCNGQTNYNLHLGGQKHKKKMILFGLEPTNANPTSLPSEVTTDTSIDEYTSFEQQQQQYRHEFNKMQKWDIQEEERNCSLQKAFMDQHQATYNQATHHYFNQTTNFSTPTQPPTFLHCEVCDVSVSCMAHLDSHFNGSKHIKKVKSNLLFEALQEMKKESFKIKINKRNAIFDADISGDNNQPDSIMKNVSETGNNDGDLSEKAAVLSEKDAVFSEKAGDLNEKAGDIRSDKDVEISTTNQNVNNDEALPFSFIDKREDKHMGEGDNTSKLDYSNLMGSEFIKESVKVKGLFMCELCDRYPLDNATLTQHLLGRRHRSIYRSKVNTSIPLSPKSLKKRQKITEMKVKKREAKEKFWKTKEQQLDVAMQLQEIRHVQTTECSN